MRSIEEKVKVPESGMDAFRNEIFRKVALAQRRGEHFDYTTDEKLKEAIRKNLKELIAEENIITSDGKKLVKIPLRYLDQYRGPDRSRKDFFTISNSGAARCVLPPTVWRWSTFSKRTR